MDSSQDTRGRRDFPGRTGNNPTAGRPGNKCRRVHLDRINLGLRRLK